jgi:XTP/dITP diphosphohydrolase
MPYLLEEAYEAYAALEGGDLVDLREELGDVLLQVVSTPGSPRRRGGGGGLVDRRRRRRPRRQARPRHPHVFAGTSADDLEGTWRR